MNRNRSNINQLFIPGVKSDNFLEEGWQLITFGEAV